MTDDDYKGVPGEDVNDMIRTMAVGDSFIIRRAPVRPKREYEFARRMGMRLSIVQLPHSSWKITRVK
jgi:hypothetical protein